MIFPREESIVDCPCTDLTRCGYGSVLPDWKKQPGKNRLLISIFEMASETRHDFSQKQELVLFYFFVALGRLFQIFC